MYADGPSRRHIANIPILSLLPGDSPRLEGEDKTHIARLAEAEEPLPPILVDRRSMRVIDGMHRLMAASLKGQETIDVEFFDGSMEDSFLRGVQANVTHGLPLTQADRRAAAIRIIASHPHLSDRAIAASAGLAARTVAGIRRSTDAVPQLNARVGRDGRVRPLNSIAGRRRAAELIAENPRASLREVAVGAGVSPATARDVRERLERGEEPAPARRATRGRLGSNDSRPTSGSQLASGSQLTSGSQSANGRPQTVHRNGHPAGLGQVSRLDNRRTAQPPAFVLEKLLRDPSLRHNELGRQLLRWLQHSAIGVQDPSEVVAAVPPHCVQLVAQLARHYAETWQDFAQELDERARVIDPMGGQRSLWWLSYSNKAITSGR